MVSKELFSSRRSRQSTHSQRPNTKSTRKYEKGLTGLAAAYYKCENAKRAMISRRLAKLRTEHTWQAASGIEREALETLVRDECTRRCEKKKEQATKRYEHVKAGGRFDDDLEEPIGEPDESSESPSGLSEGEEVSSCLFIDGTLTGVRMA